MARVQTNNISLRWAEESAVGTLPGSPQWYISEPNSIGEYGAKISTVERSPISSKRQRRKGTVVDLDSMVGFEADATLSSIVDHAKGFFFSTPVNSNMVIVCTNVDGTNDEYDVAALSAAQAGKLQYEASGFATLIYARGFSNAANNGLKVLDHDPATSGTAVGVTDTGLVDETPPANATIELAGVRAKTGDLAITVASGIATLVSGANAVTSALDFTTLGLTVGQFIHIGGLTGANQFSAGVGYGRITALSAESMTLDKLHGTLATDAGTGETVDLLFGRFMRNVSNVSSEYAETSYQFELSYPDLASIGSDMYEYAVGNFLNEISFTLPLTDKAMVEFGFIGTSSDVITGSRKTNASSALQPTMTQALNTSADIARLRITEVDETGLTTDFKELKLTINNSVTPEKVLATLGATYMNFGNFEVDIEATMVFSNADVIARVRNNTTVTMDFALKNADGAIYVDIPSLTLGDGARDYPVDETVLVNITGTAFEHPTLGTSLSMSMFPVVP